MPKKLQILTVVLSAVYVALRVWRLDASCLWFDEIFSVHAAELPWVDLFNLVARDLIHPPLFYVVLKLWIGVGGESVFALRMLPVVFSILAIIPFVNLAKELKFDRPVIVIALGLMAVNGALLKYTQTLRMYSMLMFLAVASMWLFTRYFNRGKSFVPLLIANLLLVYTHYFGWLVVGTEIAALLFFQRIKWRRAVVMTGILIASYVPWLWALWRAASEGSDVAQNIAWQARPGARQLWTFVLDLIEPIYFQASNAEQASMYLVSIPVLLVLIVAVIFYLVEWKHEERKQSVWLLTLFVLIPLVLTYGASWILPQSVWGTRHLIVTFPPTIILIANAIWSHRNPIGKVLILAALTFFSAAAIFQAYYRHSPNYVWCAWNDVATDIRQRAPGPVTIYSFENLIAYHVWFALRDSAQFKFGVVRGLDVRTDDEAYFLPRGFNGVDRVDLANISDDSFWLVFRTEILTESAAIVDAFKQRGYKECQSYHVGYGPTTVFWVEMGRTCR